jgi:hypothetical protein
MDQEQSPRIVDHFSDIITITICAVICNADTIRRVLMRLKPEQLQSSFLSWVLALRHTEGGAELIAIGGKTARRSFDSSKDKPAIHMVSAWRTGIGWSWRR